MADSSALRQRRYRLHRNGDHSLCDASRCNGDAPETRDVTPRGPRRPALEARGRRLWAEVTGDGRTLSPTELVTLEEACRAADRLDALDRILRGDEATWLRFADTLIEGVVEVRVTGVLVEVRQQQTTLARLLAELRQSRAATVAPRKPGSRPATTNGGGASVPAGVADLTARIAKRSPQAAG